MNRASSLVLFTKPYSSTPIEQASEYDLNRTKPILINEDVARSQAPKPPVKLLLVLGGHITE